MSFNLQLSSSQTPPTLLCDDNLPTRHESESKPQATPTSLCQSAPVPPLRSSGLGQHTHRRSNGHPAAHERGPAADPARQPGEPARELLPQVLLVPRAVVAAPELRGRGREPPAARRLRLPQDRRLRARQDGGGARRRGAARAHHESERHAHPSPAGYRGEADAPEPYVSPLSPCPLPSSRLQTVHELLRAWGWA